MKRKDMSSAGIDESEVLSAFTAAYNDKFKELMQAASTKSPVPVADASLCSACNSSLGMGGSARPATVVEIDTIRMPPPTKLISKCSSGMATFWTVIFSLSLLLLLIVFGMQICRAWKRAKPVFGSSMLSVDGHMMDQNAGWVSRVKDVTEPHMAVPNDDICVVIYHAEWCGHCKVLRPIFDKLANQSSKSLNFYSCENTVLEASGKSKTGDFNISGYPTTIAFEKGKKIKEIVGNVSEATLKSFIDGLTS
jgi:thioredoxin 1